MRCFIALCLPEEARLALARTSETCRAACSADGVRPRISWTRPEGYHLTLAFLGEIEGPAIDAAASAIDAASGFEAISCRFAGLGGFPFGRNRGKEGSSAALWRVLFAKLDDGGGCAELYRAVNEALAERARLAALPPLNPEWPNGAAGGRAFAPHVTLARAQAGLGIPPEAARWVGTAHPETWTIGRCALYKSELRRTGAVYTEIRGVGL
jgi:RNA 2',3'-cyclic 3'-phosphodiesterase